MPCTTPDQVDAFSRSHSSTPCNFNIHRSYQVVKLRRAHPVKEFVFEDSGKEISRRNRVLCRNQTDNFDKAIQDTIETIHTDFEWVKYHTKLQVKASEWIKKQPRKKFAIPRKRAGER